MATIARILHPCTLSFSNPAIVSLVKSCYDFSALYQSYPTINTNEHGSTSFVSLDSLFTFATSKEGLAEDGLLFSGVARQLDAHVESKSLCHSEEFNVEDVDVGLLLSKSCSPISEATELLALEGQPALNPITKAKHHAAVITDEKPPMSAFAYEALDPSNVVKVQQDNVVSKNDMKHPKTLLDVVQPKMTPWEHLVTALGPEVELFKWEASMKASAISCAEFFYVWKNDLRRRIADLHKSCEQYRMTATESSTQLTYIWRASPYLELPNKHYAESWNVSFFQQLDTLIYDVKKHCEDIQSFLLKRGVTIEASLSKYRKAKGTDVFEVLLFAMAVAIVDFARHVDAILGVLEDIRMSLEAFVKYILASGIMGVAVNIAQVRAMENYYQRIFWIENLIGTIDIVMLNCATTEYY